MGGEVFYEAISYVWGNRDLANTIRCEYLDGGGGQVCLPLTRSAADALRAVRKVDAVRMVWIDSISISQTSSVEKTAQVAMMDTIFANSTTVLIWLGAEDGLRSAAAAQITTLIHEQFGPEMQAFTASEVNSRGDSLARQKCYDQVGTVLPLFECEWFWRLWCVQELALARQSLIYWGSIVLKWDAILTTAAFIQSQAQQQVAHMGVAGVYNVIMLEALRKQINRGEQPDYLPRDMPFSRLLSLTRLHGVTEPCDRVFSLLGLDSRISMTSYDLESQKQREYQWLHSERAEHSSWPQKQPLVTPDYSQNIDTIYLSTAKALLTRERNLHLLSFVQHDAEVAHGDLPSWAPRWHINNHRLITQCDLIPNHPVYAFLEDTLARSGVIWYIEWRASLAEPRSPTVPKQNTANSDRALHAEGLILATVTEVCSEIAFPAERSNQWLATLRRWFRRVSAWFMHHNKFDRPDLPSSQFDEVLFHIFYRTLLGGHFRAEELFMEWREQLYRFSGPDLGGNLSMATMAERAKRTRFCID